MCYRYILWAGLLVQACSVSRQQQNTMTHSAHTDAVQTYVHRTDQLDTIDQSRILQFRRQRDIVAFTPIGTFSYHPDSGFRGQASRVIVSRSHTEALDSSLNSRNSVATKYTSLRSETNSQEISEVTGQLNMERVPFAPKWLWLTVGIATVAFLFLFFRRR